LRIWLDVGMSEESHFLGAARQIRDALLTKGWHLGSELAYYEQPGGGHTEAAWAQRVAPMLYFLFPTTARTAWTA
jgi:enterochelin esterase-like enzyme